MTITPKKGEKARKLGLIKKGKGVRPPKKWFDKVKRSVDAEYGYSKERTGRIIGGIWSGYSRKAKEHIIKKYQR